MVICIIALPIFALLGLFSLKYRLLAKEAFSCTFKTIVFRPCDSGLDIRIKSLFTAKLMWWPWLSRTFYRYFTLLSWIFVILMLLSVAGTGYGVYNYAMYGNCNGPDSNLFCVFNIVHSGQDANLGQCSSFGVTGNISVADVKMESYPIKGDLSSSLVLHEFGCYSCPYTRNTEQAVLDVLEKYPNIKFVYHDVPLEIHSFSLESARGAICAGEQDKYWEYHELLFKQANLTNSSFVSLASQLNLNVSQFNSCFNSNKTTERINFLQNEASKVGIYGTPTFVLDGEFLVGEQSYKSLKSFVGKEIR